MNKRDIIERVASGLRKMDIKPDMFVYNNTDDTWDDDDICGIPVMNSSNFKLYAEGSLTYECNFLPTWKRDYLTMWKDLDYFYKGYDEL